MPTPSSTDLISVRTEGAAISDAERKGRAILLDSSGAYSRLQSYTGSIALSSTYRWGAQQVTEARRARVCYHAPCLLRIESSDSNNDVFYVVADARKRHAIAWYAGETAPHSSGTVEEVLTEYTGVSLDITLLLPGMLLATEWHAQTFTLPNGRLLPAFASKARYDGDAPINDVMCHKVRCERPIGTWTFYVGCDDKLVHRIDNSVSEAQMGTQRALGGGGWSGQIGESLTTQTFSIESVDAELDGSLFEPVPK